MSEAHVLITRVGDELRARGERMTGPRRAVLAALSGHAGHLSAEGVYELVAAEAADIHRSTVYRTLEALSELGVVQHVHLGHGGTAYHLADVDDEHLHAQCRLCGTVVDLPGDLLDEIAGQVEREHGFRLDPAHTAMSGTCRECLGSAG